MRIIYWKVADQAIRRLIIESDKVGMGFLESYKRLPRRTRITLGVVGIIIGLAGPYLLPFTPVAEKTGKDKDAMSSKSSTPWRHLTYEPLSWKIQENNRKRPLPLSQDYFDVKFFAVIKIIINNEGF